MAAGVSSMLAFEYELRKKRERTNQKADHATRDTKKLMDNTKTLISLFDKVHFYIFVMLIELVSVRLPSINLNQKDIDIHSNLTVLQAPTGCRVAAC